jgi:hypothetical protein
MIMRCHRCNGIMANERFYGPGEPFWGWRCIICGEVFDALIWENRDHCKKIEIMGGGGSSKGNKGRR